MRFVGLLPIQRERSRSPADEGLARRPTFHHLVGGDMSSSHPMWGCGLSPPSRRGPGSVPRSGALVHPRSAFGIAGGLVALGILVSTTGARAGSEHAASTPSAATQVQADAAAEPRLQVLARDLVGAGQGVYVVDERGTILVSQAADVAVHPASVSKIATTLALLRKLGAEHRFETRVRAGGPIEDGVLHGDLVVEAGNDPFLVSEGALLILDRLHSRGIRHVDGRVRVAGELLLNWQPDPEGRRLERVWSGTEGREAWPAVATATAMRSLREAAITFHDDGAVATAGATVEPRSSAGDLLARYRSPSLLHVVKVLNGFSNNIFHFASDAIGGPAVVQVTARESVPPEMREEIILDNGAGAGTTNRLSPRAAVALLAALEEELARSGHSLVDALPVSGVDPGTLEERLPGLRATVVGKTGTFGSVGASALAGAMRTPGRGGLPGEVRFAVLNHGVPVPEARRRQDAFVRALATAIDAQPWPHEQAIVPDYLAARVD